MPLPRSPGHAGLLDIVRTANPTARGVAATSGNPWPSHSLLVSPTNAAQREKDGKRYAVPCAS